jgi:carboxypeptidase Q
MPRSSQAVLALALSLSSAVAAAAQQTPPPPTAAPPATPAAPWNPSNPVLARIWDEARGNSQLERLAQALSDSVGPRLTASPGMKAGSDWLIAQYRAWGIPARTDTYGTFRSWRRGVSHIDLVQPRVRSLEGTMLAWSPATRGPVTAGVVAMPTFTSAAELEAWLPGVRGKYVLASLPPSTCRPLEEVHEYATPETFERLQRQVQEAPRTAARRLTAIGLTARELPRRLEAAGAVGVVTSTPTGGWGVDRIFNAYTRQVPTFDLSCEDYGLVYRLSQHGQNPVLRAEAQSEELGEVPVFNTVAEIRGSEKPDEYVILSAHFDSWDGSSGATDNGTGTVTMMEAARILRAVYPRPRRTILVGHWSGEEQGLNGSRAFVKDHPQVVNGLQVLLNQDNGTGRVVSISMQGFTGVGAVVSRWLSQLPPELTGEIKLDDPGVPSQGGSDYASFVCAGVPALGLSSLGWDYGAYTWHTNRDTYDKIIFDDVRKNAALTAMLAYLASEDPQRLPREQRTTFPTNPGTGQPYTWPACQDASRTTAASPRM